MGFPQVIQDDCKEKKGAHMGKRLPDNYHFKLSTAKPFQGSKSGAQAGRQAPFHAEPSRQPFAVSTTLLRVLIYQRAN